MKGNRNMKDTNQTLCVYTHHDTRATMVEYIPDDGQLNRIVDEYINEEQTVTNAVSQLSYSLDDEDEEFYEPTRKEVINAVLEHVTINVAKVPNKIFESMKKNSDDRYLIKWRDGNKEMEGWLNQCKDVSGKYPIHNPNN